VSVTDLETVLLEDVGGQLDPWRPEFAGRPEAERERLLLLALERKQIVAVAYREEAVAGRVAALDVGDAARAREADLSGAGFEVTQARAHRPYRALPGPHGHAC